ncbi:MAG: site-specific integrase [Deltaproteobacteria bacterium]|nr:site-specific integrase [Deltaproteobacteria bacterium]
MFRLMLRCGLRVEEVANLTVGAIDFPRRKVNNILPYVSRVIVSCSAQF